jgi:hypothetical protein
MGLEASVYTPDASPIPRDDLVRAAAEAGWFLQTVRDIFDPSRFCTVNSGTVTDGDYFYGWRMSDRYAKDYEQALVSKQVEQLERWAQEDPDRELGAAFIYGQQYQHEYSPDQEAELAEQTGPECVAALKAARLEYLIDLHANNDDFRLDLAKIVCRLRGGLWMDHLNGEWGVVHA